MGGAAEFGAWPRPADDLLCPDAWGEPELELEEDDICVTRCLDLWALVTFLEVGGLFPSVL